MSDRLIPFHKMHGCGNDFVFIDNRIAQAPVSAMAKWAKAICQQHTGVGADGLVFLDTTPQDWTPKKVVSTESFGGKEVSQSTGCGIDSEKRQAPFLSAADPNCRPDYIWHFYNADGSRAGMCGNASRCAALLAVELGLAGVHHTLGTDAGLVRAEAKPESGEAEVELMPVHDVRPVQHLEVDGLSFCVRYVNTGVPHAVIFMDSEILADFDVQRFGKDLRYHAVFAPDGANVNFAGLIGQDHLLLRTYERGVEGETLACGTGAAATAYLAFLKGLTGPDVRLTTSGGENLGIRIRRGENGDRPFLSGKAIKVFSGALSCAALKLPFSA